MEKSYRKAFVFVLLTISISWAIIELYFALGGKWIGGGFKAFLMGIVYMWVPATVAIAVQKWIYRESLKKPLGISFSLNQWFLVAWFLPPVLALASAGISLAFPGVSFSADMSGLVERMMAYARDLPPEQLEALKAQLAATPLWVAILSGIIQGLLAGATINALAAFGEELGWRGLLFGELLPLGFWKSQALIGLIWGLWHAPIILRGHNYPQHPVPGVLMMCLFCLFLSPIIGYIRLKSKSVLAATLMHGSLNGTAGISLLFIRGGNDLTVGITGAAGLIAMALANLAIYLWGKPERSQ
ncbi:MAG: CPBP family intramembrane glutamic endopeptidase [Anaerolineae bacterium]|nr:CPBP family intramembrane metalloprotease [Anaerolineae bacterium]MDW8102794.1 CPBP family intramembrane glutamic endopeptidase [Anaerolineae bacterium]